jgi:opacity protein-like surface antigen
MKRRLLAGAVFGLLLLFTSVAKADEGSRQEVGVQGTGFFTKDSSGRTSSGDGISQHATNTGGFLLSYRYHFKGWLGADISYGYDRNTQKNLVAIASPVGIARSFNIQTNVHQATAALVVSVPARLFRLNPYVLAGTGALVFAPTGNTGGSVPGAGTQGKAAFVYGGGADYNLGRHLALRLEYRGFVYKRPSGGLSFLSSGSEGYTSQPSAGVVWHF